MRSLVTGGAGFMGSHLARDLLSLGHDVVVLDDLSGGFAENVPSGAEFIRGSINDGKLLEGIFREHSFDHVFHLAAYAAEGLSHFIRHFNYENNLLGSVNLINMSVRHKVKCFVFTSSIAVYGENQLPMKEETAPSPEDPYGISKYAVEMDLRAANRVFGLDYIVFRPHNVYGENQNLSDKYRNVIGIFMNQIMNGKPQTIFGDGTQKRAFTYIADVSPVIAKSVHVAKAYNQVFNLGSDTPHTVNELLKTVCAEFGVEPNPVHLPAREEVKDAWASHEKIRQYFGFKPKHSLKDGVHRMADWARKTKPRPQVRFKNIEIEDNLPPSWKE